MEMFNSEKGWYDIMDGDLYRELLKPGGFLTSENIILLLLFNTDGVHAFKASRDQIWPFLLIVNEVHPSVRYARFEIMVTKNRCSCCEVTKY